MPDTFFAKNAQDVVLQVIARNRISSSNS